MLSDKDIMARLKSAQQDRGRWHARLDDYYHYAMPYRSNSEGLIPERPDELYDGTAVGAVQDFAADMLTHFTPGHVSWLKLKPSAGTAGSKSELSKMQSQLDALVGQVFAEIRRSNYGQAAQESYADLATGTMAMMIEDRGATDPIHCEAIPLPCLLIDRGPYGEVDGRFRNVRPCAFEIPLLWPDATIGRELAQTIKNAPNTRLDVQEGFVRDRKSNQREAWTYCVMVKDKTILRDEVEGVGSCALLVARWFSDPLTAWGTGPLTTALPDIKTLNKLQELILRRLDKVVDPITFYDDDGIINLENGADAGDWIARAPGSRIETLESQHGFDSSFFEREALQMAIKRALFQDKPHQRGRTPPTATQWLEESAELARRMGAPAGRLVPELQMAVFWRFAHLLAKRGKIAPLDDASDLISAEPLSPLALAQQQEDVMNLTRMLEINQQGFGPQIAGVLVDPFAAAEYVRGKLGVPQHLLVPQQEAKAKLEELMQGAQQLAQQ